MGLNLSFWCSITVVGNAFRSWISNRKCENDFLFWHFTTLVSIIRNINKHTQYATLRIKLQSRGNRPEIQYSSSLKNEIMAKFSSIDGELNRQNLLKLFHIPELRNVGIAWEISGRKFTMIKQNSLAFLTKFLAKFLDCEALSIFMIFL